MTMMPLDHLPAVLQLLAAQGAQRSYRKGALILQDGEQGDSIYILITGRARAFGASLSGKEITYGYVSAGEYFGEMTLDGGTRSASVEAMEACVCSVVTNTQVQAFMEQHPNFAKEMLHTVIARARQSTNSARDIALLDVYTRLKHTIEKHAPDIGSSLNISHAELAADIGASREMVSKLLKDLEQGAYIEMKSRQLSVLKKLPARW